MKTLSTLMLTVTTALTLHANAQLVTSTQDLTFNCKATLVIEKVLKTHYSPEEEPQAASIKRVMVEVSERKNGA